MGWNGGNVRTCYGTLLAEISWLVSGIQICGWFHVMFNFLFVKYKLIWRIIWAIAIGWDDLYWYGNGQKSIYPVEQKINSILRLQIRAAITRSPMGQCSGLEAGWKLRKVYSLRTTESLVFFFKCDLFVCFFCFVCFVFRSFQTSLLVMTIYGYWNQLI